MTRFVSPEILDNLDPSDPRALRSRRDLRLINTLMGNFAWVGKSLLNHGGEGEVAEVGAGEGILSAQLARHCPVTGMDLVPRPEKLPSQVGWIQGDFFASLADCSAPRLVGVMILHHFSDEKLRELGRMIQERRILCFCEPHRSRRVLWFGTLLNPLVNSVTRHDMAVSIRAGFRRGELAELMGLRSPEWQIQEYCDWRGSLRMLACRL